LKPIQKPHWLSANTFDELLKREQPLPKCKHCGTSDDLAVDHIKPRSEGGADELDNLQFLCRPCNSKKGVRADAYWSRRFYWDDPPAGLANLRNAQKFLFEEITTNEYFHKSLSEIARLLYVCAWVVGAGKTIGIAVAAWALNLVVLRERGKVRRADRLLVVCKEEAIRDQIAHDLAKDLIDLGIASHAPKIGRILKNEQWSQQEWIDQYDVIVTCVHQLWQKDEIVRADIAKVLAMFPLIAIDEPHFAADRIATLVDAATSSLCIGFTGTPIDNAGKLLERMVALSTYTYQDAVELDYSLKYLSDDPAAEEKFVRELKIHDARLTKHGQPTVTTDTDHPGYDLNLPPIEAICSAVIEELKASDGLVLADERLAPHRMRNPKITKNRIFPRHSIIYFDSIAAAEDAAIASNQWFSVNRLGFPAEDGWQVAVVHGGTENTPAKPLARANSDAPHPWMRAYRNGGKLDAECARLLYCVGMAREGVNNPFCGLTGAACGVASLFPPIQGWFGRQLRAVILFFDDMIQVPPAPLDTVRLITHEAYGNIPTIRAAIGFLCNMGEHFEGLPSINDLLDSEPPPKPTATEPSLWLKDKIHILGWVKDREDEGASPTVENVVDAWSKEPGPRADRIRKFAKICVERDTDALRKELGLDQTIKPIVTVRSERLKHNPSDEDLERFIRKHHPDLNDVLPLEGSVKRVALKLHAKHIEQFYQPRIIATTSINTLAHQIAGMVQADLGVYYQGLKKKLFEYATKAVRRKLDVPPHQTLANNSDWDTPETHATIRHPRTQSEIIRWIIARLIKEGDCPQLRDAMERQQEMHAS
jgi:hypothetical protein